MNAAKEEFLRGDAPSPQQSTFTGFGGMEATDLEADAERPLNQGEIETMARLRNIMQHTEAFNAGSDQGTLFVKQKPVPTVQSLLTADAG